MTVARVQLARNQQCPYTAAMDENWMSVPEAAERLGTSEEMIRRHIRDGRLFAERSGRGSRSAWRVDARQVALEAEQELVRERLTRAGIVTGRGGTPEADAEFIGRVSDEHGDQTAQAVEVAMDRAALIEEAARFVDEHRNELGLAFTALDDEELFEKEAQVAAERVRRAERLQRRMFEILDEDTDE